MRHTDCGDGERIFGFCSDGKNQMKFSTPASHRPLSLECAKLDVIVNIYDNSSSKSPLPIVRIKLFLRVDDGIRQVALRLLERQHLFFDGVPGLRANRTSWPMPLASSRIAASLTCFAGSSAWDTDAASALAAKPRCNLFSLTKSCGISLRPASWVIEWFPGRGAIGPFPPVKECSAVVLLAFLIIVCGSLAASGYIIQRKPDARQLFDRLAPYQGVMGVILVLWSVWSLFDSLKYFTGETGRTVRRLAAAGLISSGKFTFAAWSEMTTGIVGVLLGFLLAYALISKYALSKNAAAAERGAVVQAKLVGIQIPLGAAGIVCGLLLIVAKFNL
jgi:hypothetical protein